MQMERFRRMAPTLYKLLTVSWPSVLAVCVDVPKRKCIDEVLDESNYSCVESTNLWEKSRLRKKVGF